MSEARMRNEIDELLNEVRRLNNRLYHAGEALHADESITLGMRAVLEYLEREGPGTVPQIARSRSVSRQHIQTIVNGLLGEALVMLDENPQHKRSPLVTPTPKGRQTIRRMQQREQRLYAEMNFDIPSSQILAATKTLRKIHDVFDSKEQQS